MHFFFYMEAAMKKSILFLLIAGGLPLLAQSYEVGLFLGQQQYPSPHADVMPGTTLQMEAASKTVWGLRFGYAVTDMGPALLQFTAGFQPEAKSDVKGSLGGSPAVVVGDFKQQHWSAGAMATFKTVVAVGVGVEFRSEKLSGNLGGSSDSTTYNRAWVRANAGYAVPSPVLKPFFGVEVAFPLTTTSLSADASNAETLKALSAKSQFGIYAGLRF